MQRGEWSDGIISYHTITYRRDVQTVTAETVIWQETPFFSRVLPIHNIRWNRNTENLVSSDSTSENIRSITSAVRASAAE